MGSAATGVETVSITNGREDAKGAIGEQGEQGITEWEGYVRSRKRKWATLGFSESHMDDLEGTALGYVSLPPPPSTRYPSLLVPSLMILFAHRAAGSPTEKE